MGLEGGWGSIGLIVFFSVEVGFVPQSAAFTCTPHLQEQYIAGR